MIYLNKFKKTNANISRIEQNPSLRKAREHIRAKRPLGMYQNFKKLITYNLLLIKIKSSLWGDVKRFLSKLFVVFEIPVEEWTKPGFFKYVQGEIGP